MIGHCERGNFGAINKELRGFLYTTLADFNCCSVKINWHIFGDKIK